MPNTTRRTPANTKKKKTALPPAQDTFGNLQPQAPEMEKAVLGAMLIEQDAFSIVSDILNEESFYEPRHQKIFRAIKQLNLEEKPVDILTVAEQLEKTEDLADVGGAYYISELSSMVGSSAHLQYHARIIAQKFMARELIRYTAAIQGEAFDATTDVDELMQRAEGELFEISQRNLKKDYTQIDPVVIEAYKNIQAAAARDTGLSGISSGFTELDKYTNGWQNSDLIILAARPAMGKTAFALSMAKNIAIDQKIPMAFFSLEMSNLQLINRIISNVCEIDSNTLRSGQLKNYEWEQLDYRINQLKGAPLFTDDTASLSVFELRTKARRLVREHGVRIIMIDYLQLMNASGMNFFSRQEEVSTISRSLKGLAKELNIPILALSQVNRNLESRGDGSKGNKGNEARRPQLSDLRESGAIEQDADMVCFIHRPDYYQIYEDDHGNDIRGIAQIIIAKHRNGATGDVNLTFKKEYARFENIESGRIPLPGQENQLLNSGINGELPVESNINLPQDGFPPADANDLPFIPTPKSPY